MVFRISNKKTFYIFDLKAIHNKDYSVVKTFKAGQLAFFFIITILPFIY